MSGIKRAVVTLLTGISNILLCAAILQFFTVFIDENKIGIKPVFPILFFSISLVSLALYLLSGKDAVKRTWAFKFIRLILEKGVKLFQHKPFALLTGLFIFYSTLYVVIGTLRYSNFYASVRDIGNVYQALWNTLHGEFLINSIKGNTHRFLDHVEPIILIFLPLVKAFKSPLVLVTAQNIAIFLSIFPLYLLSRLWVKNPYLIVAIIFSYVAYMPIRGILIYDYHTISLFVPIFFFALYFLDMKKYGLYFLFVLLSALCKETIGFKLLFFGLALAIFRQKQRGVGILTVALGIIQLYIVFVLVIPALGGSYMHSSLYEHLGDTVWEKVMSPIMNPRVFWGEIFNYKTLNYLFMTLAPLLFLPIFEPLTLIPLAIIYAQLILPEGSGTINYKKHYAAEFLPFLFYGYILVLAKIEKARGLGEKRVKAMAMCLLVLAALFYEKPDIQYLLKFAKPVSSDVKTIKEAIRLYVPPDASVAANACIAAHMLNRRHIYPVERHRDFPVDYVVVHESLCPPYPLKNDEVFLKELESMKYELVFRSGSLSIYRNPESTP